MVAIDPEPRGGNVLAVALDELDEPASSFDATVAVLSLHHVNPLEASCERLAEVMRPGATLLVDEFDVARFDLRAAGWWLDQRHTLGGSEDASAGEVVEEHRAELHPLERIIEQLRHSFEVGLPVRGAYLYRWDLDESLRPLEEDLIANGELPAVGARFLARRRSISA
jgi:SAM-dependent methyltransferase